MTISEKVAYLKGMAEGLDIDTESSKEGKLISMMMDILQDVALELEDLLERGERTATGVAKKGIQALRLRLKGYSTREIGTYLGAPDNYVTAWEAKARKYLRALK